MPGLLENAVNAFLPGFFYDQVAIFDQNFKQIFATARPLKAVVKEQAKLMEHPIETGATIVDHRIILPVEIELSLVLESYFGVSVEYQQVYNAIREAYLNSVLLTVQTRSGVYTNQLIQSLPHEEDPTQYDVLTLALSLKQVIFVTAQYGTTPKNPSNSNTTNRGMQLPMSATEPQTTTAQDLVGLANKGFKYIGSFF
jgi:hypothetical protein